MSGISHKTTEEEHHPTTECCICYEDCSEQFARGLSYPQNADDLKGKCSHITCRSCIAQYFTLKINEGNIQQEDFNCPEISCGHIIGSEIVPQYVNWEVTKKMELMKISKNPELAKECCICYEDCTDEYYFKGLSYPTNSDSHDGKKCGHVTCRGCISKYFHFKINERKVQEEDFKCPGVPCDHVIEISTVLKFVNWDEAEKLKRFQREDELAKDPMNVYCPEPACNAITKKKSLNASVSECHVCQFKFCNYCLGKHHPFQTCSMARDKAYFEWVRQRQRYGEGVKSCPKCKFQIEKTGGCAHMTCRKCNHQFCWGCLSYWNGSCTRKRWCAFVKFNDHHLWGPNPLVRAGTKTAAAVVAIPVGAVAAGIVVVIGTVAVSGALVFGVPVLAIKAVHKHIKEAKQRERVKYFEQSLTRSTKLLSGYRVLLVGFDGFLTKAVDELSGQVPGGKATGRWVSGKNRQYLFYDLALGGLSNLVYVEEASTVCCPTLPEGVCTCPGTWDLVVVRPGRPPLLTAWQRAAPHRVAVHEDGAAVAAAAGTEELKDEGGEEEEEKAGEEGPAAAPLEELPPGLEEQALGAFRPSEEAIETLQSPEEVLLASFRFQNKHHRVSLQMPSWGAGRKGKTQRPAAASAARNKDSKRGTQPISGSVQCSKFTLTELTTLILRSLDESHPLAMG